MEARAALKKAGGMAAKDLPDLTPDERKEFTDLSLQGPSQIHRKYAAIQESKRREIEEKKTAGLNNDQKMIDPASSSSTQPNPVRGRAMPFPVKAQPQPTSSSVPPTLTRALVPPPPMRPPSPQTNPPWGETHKELDEFLDSVPRNHDTPSSS
jgi:hypothetical protein